MLHYPADDDCFSVADGVDVQLCGVVEELIDQDRVFAGDLEGIVDAGIKRLSVVDDLHSPSAQDERRTDQHRIA